MGYKARGGSARRERTRGAADVIGGVA
jgi:hypothetical protein